MGHVAKLHHAHQQLLGCSDYVRGMEMKTSASLPGLKADNRGAIMLPELTSFALWQVCGKHVKCRYSALQSTFHSLTSLATSQAAPWDSWCSPALLYWWEPSHS